MSSMDQYGYNSSGGSHRFLLPFVIAAVLFIIAAGFGAWAYTERQDYKDNSDQKAAAAAEAAKMATQQEEAAKYTEEAKSPLKTFIGPADFGSVTFQYPKTWSGYVVQDSSSSSDMPLDGYFHPDVVPDVDLPASVFALRVSIVSEPYSEVLENYASSVEEGKAVVAPYKLPKVDSVVGSRVDGDIEQGKKGSMVLLPLRNVTLKVWTETDQYLNDFNGIVLASLSFSP